jgi:hypothetical protein
MGYNKNKSHIMSNLKTNDMIRIIRNNIALSILVMILFSCGNQDRTNEKKDPLVKDTANPITAGSEKLLETGFKLVENESLGNLKNGLSLKKLVESIGNPEGKSKLEIFGADGLYHQEWKYPKKGIVLDMAGESEPSLVVNTITISEPCELKTKRNIGIGSPKEAVQSSYKDEIDPSSLNTESILAGTVFGGIQFRLEKNKVKSIFIGAAAE